MRWLYAVLFLLLLLIALTVGGYAYLVNADLSQHRVFVENAIEEATGRKLTIQGAFEPVFSATPSLRLSDVTFANAEWATEAHMLSAEELRIQLDLWSLLSKPVFIQDLEVRGAVIHLQRDEDGRANWEFEASDGEEADTGGFDPEAIVFGRVLFDRVQLSYSDPHRAAPLDLSVSVLELLPADNGMLAFGLEGDLDGDTLSGEGHVGPLESLLAGRDLTQELALRWGESTLTLRGEVGDVRRLKGLDLVFETQGPEMARVVSILGLRPLGTGPFQFSGQVGQGEEEGENPVALSGAGGGIELDIEGSIGGRRNRDGLDLQVSLSGPDAAVLGKAVGWNRLPPEPFGFSARIQGAGRAYRLADVSARVGEADIDASGLIDISSNYLDLELLVESSGPDFSLFQDFARLPPLPSAPFRIAGGIKKKGLNYQFENVRVRVGGDELDISGKLGAGGLFEGTDLTLAAAGPDLSSLESLTGIPGLPAEPFKAAGRLRAVRRGLEIQNFSAEIAHNKIDLDGLISASEDLSGSDLHLSVSGTDIATAFALAGFGQDLPSGLPFGFKGHIEVLAGGYRLDTIEAELGRLKIRADGTLGRFPVFQDTDLTFDAQGPIRSGLEGSPEQNFSVTGRVYRTPQSLALEGFEARLGESEMTGSLSVDLGARPHLLGSFASPYLDLSVLAQAQLGSHHETTDEGDPGKEGRAENAGTAELSVEVGELEQQKDEEQEQGQDKEKEQEYSNDPLISDTRLPLEWLDVLDGELQFNAGRARYKDAQVLDLQVDVRLKDGRLSMENLSMRGPLDGSASGGLVLEPKDGTALLEVNLKARKLRLVSLSGDEASLLDRSPLDVDLELRGVGDSLSAILGAANGRVEVIQGEGRIDGATTKLLFSDIVMRLFRTLNPFSKEDLYTEVECGVYIADIEDGVADAVGLVMRTNKLTIIGQGSLNLGTEKLNLILRTKPREGLGISLGGLANSFVKFGGTLREPTIKVDAVGSVTTTGAAVATGGLSILAKGLWDRVTAERDVCRLTRERAAKKERKKAKKAVQSGESSEPEPPDMIER